VAATGRGNVGSISVDLIGLAGYVLTVVVGLAAYHAGLRAGARAAHRVWTNWTGISPEELQSHRFDRELRNLRRDIERPVDAWPEQGKED
jgi:predicted N-acetyltransferase YhbS